MQPRSRRARRFLPPLTALLLLGGLYALSRQPTLPQEKAGELAHRFRFEKRPLPELPGHSYNRTVRDVHPSLEHIRSWISFVGAGVCLADLDGDGLPNDLVYVDPRIDQAVVAPAPGTGSRFEPFALDPSPLTFDTSNMAPMGSRSGDFNEDGFPDVLVYYWGRSPIVFLQRPESESNGMVPLTPSTFIPRELVEPHETWFTSAVSRADLDGDGHIDLVVGNYYPEDSRVLDSKAGGVEEMMQSMSRAYNAGRNRLLLWKSGTGAPGPTVHFEEVRGILDRNVACGWTLAVGAADLDADLLPELYFAQDFGPDRLLHNRSRPGQPRFVLLEGRRTFMTPRSLVLGRDSFNGMGVDFGDLNGDARPDIFVSNITCDFGLHESNLVFLSEQPTRTMREGIAPYRNASERLGLSRAGWTWDVKLGDFDNNGALEVIQAAGFTKGNVDRWPELHELAVGNDELMQDPRFLHAVRPGDDVAGDDHNPFFVRAGDGRYYDLARHVGLAEPMLSRGIATGDIDGDGRLDFAVANNWERSVLFYNAAPDPGAFLGLHLRLPTGPRANEDPVLRTGHPQREVDGPTRPAIGATATVHLPDGRRLVSQVDGGNGHSGQRSTGLHFGLGALDPSRPLQVDVRWRDGRGRVRSRTVSCKPDHWYTLLLGVPQNGGQEENRE